MADQSTPAAATLVDTIQPFPAGSEALFPACERLPTSLGEASGDVGPYHRRDRAVDWVVTDYEPPVPEECP